MTIRIVSTTTLGGKNNENNIEDYYLAGYKNLLNSSHLSLNFALSKQSIVWTLKNKWKMSENFNIG